MDFKTKDLLVTVRPRATAGSEEAARVCVLRTLVCFHPTRCAVHSLCSPYTQIPCGPCSRFITCHHCSFAFTGGCQIFNSCGGPGGSACDPTYFCIGGSGDPFVIRYREDLTSLRADLKETLARLDAVEKGGLPSSIGSKAEAEALEDGLTAALEQVRAAKKGLK